MTETTTIVVGGGLAGSAFAIELARHGRRVIVLERTLGPHHKVCGEFLSAEAQTLLGHLGLDVWQLGASPATNLGLEFATSLPLVALPFRGAGLSRYRLDEALLEVAARAGAKVLRGVTVSKIEQRRDTMMVHTAAAPLSATHVVLATGKHNLRGVSRPQTANIAFKIQLKLRRAATDALEHLVHLSVFRGGYAGVCLVEDAIATVCWVIERDVLADAAPTWATHAGFLANRSAFFADLLTEATTLWDRPVAVAAIPYGFLRETVVAEAIYPVGDQLVVIPSYTGDGTSIALHTGMAAARAVLDGKTASQFQASALAKLKPQIAWAKLANIAFANSTAQRLAGAVARVAPWALPPAATFIATRTRLRL